MLEDLKWLISELEPVAKKDYDNSKSEWVYEKIIELKKKYDI